jgi:hypothetical protein
LGSRRDYAKGLCDFLSKARKNDLSGAARRLLTPLPSFRSTPGAACAAASAGIPPPRPPNSTRIYNMLG